MWRAVSKGKAGPRISDWRVPGEWDRGGSQLAKWRMSLATEDIDSVRVVYETTSSVSLRA
jgi:hypothetical protein